MPKRLPILLILTCLVQICRAQDSLTIADRVINFPSSFFSAINKKATTLDDRLTRQTEKYLERLSRQWQEKINGKITTTSGNSKGEYLPYADSLKTSLSFLQQNKQLLSNTKAITEKLQGSLSSISQLQSKLQQTEQLIDGKGTFERRLLYGYMWS